MELPQHRSLARGQHIHGHYQLEPRNKVEEDRYIEEEESRSTCQHPAFFAAERPRIAPHEGPSVVGSAHDPTTLQRMMMNEAWPAQLSSANYRLYATNHATANRTSKSRGCYSYCVIFFSRGSKIDVLAIYEPETGWAAAAAIRPTIL